MNKEELYIKAKNAYYNGEPIMDDDTFDELEKSINSDLRNNVGVIGIKTKFKHITPMLSLNKIKVLNEKPENSKISLINWINKLNPNSSFLVTPKFDGNAINVIYVNNKLDKILTRGNGTSGVDLTHKLNNYFPKNIESNFNFVEKRFEAVLPIDVFNKKYSNFKNPRNFVAGVLGSKNIESSILDDLEFLLVDERVCNKDGKIHSFINFEKTYFFEEFHNSHELINEFENLYKRFKTYRENSKYQLDGFVISVKESEHRLSLPENSHAPEWAMAIKFSPKTATTEVENIIWNIGKTGNFTPVAKLKYVNLDGTTISNVSCYNAKYIRDNKLGTGSKIVIHKSGDIIPQIKLILNESNNLNIPTKCPHCNSNLKDDSVNIYCDNEECEGLKFERFANGLHSLGLFYLGGSTIKKLFDSGLTEAYKIFKIKNFNEFLNEDNKNFDKIYEQLNKIKKLKISKIIALLGIPNLGGSTIKQLANKISDINYNSIGLEKKFFTDEFINKIKNKINLIKNDLKDIVEIINEEEIKVDSNVIKFEMTGSPKNFGYKTKNDFIKKMTSLGYIHTKLNEADVLFTDDINGNSSKMKTAKNKNLEIKLYE